MNDKKISPLEILVAAHNEVPPVKVTPKNRFEEETQIFPIIEALPINTGENQPIVIANSSFTLNLNMNIDNETLDKAMKKSAEVAKNIAAMGAAFLGTAMLFGQSKKVSKVKIPLTPKTKLPKL
jgi:hypothetical protein